MLSPIAVMLTERKHFCDTSKQIPVCVNRLTTISTEKLECLDREASMKIQKTRFSTQCPIFLATIHRSSAYVKWKMIKNNSFTMTEKIPWGQSYHSTFPIGVSPHFRRTGQLQLALSVHVTKHWLVWELLINVNSLPSWTIPFLRKTGFLISISMEMGTSR